jgi:L-ribulokinase
VLNKPVLIPAGDVTSLGSAIFAFLAAGAFPSIEAAQQALCPDYRTIEPQPEESRRYEKLFPLFRDLYFGFGAPHSEGLRVGRILPQLREIAFAARRASVS